MTAPNVIEIEVTTLVVAGARRSYGLGHNSGNE